MRPVLGGGRYSTGDLQSLVLIKGLGQGQGRDRNLESNWTLRNKKLEKINKSSPSGAFLDPVIAKPKVVLLDVCVVTL